MIKRLTEGRSVRASLAFDINTRLWSEDLDEAIWDNSSNGIMISPKDAEVPFAWDLVIEDISNGMITIEGDFGQQGTHNGSVTIKVPADKFNRYYDCFIDGIDADSHLLDDLRSYGVKVTIS